MTFTEALKVTEQQAKDTGQLLYLCENRQGYFISKNYYKDWLFRAYPGGRKEFSGGGRKILWALGLID